MNISLSAVDQASANAFLKSILAITAAYSKELPTPVLNMLPDWSGLAASFVSQFRIGLPNYKNIIQIISNEDYDNAKLHERILTLATLMYKAKIKFRKELDLSKDQLAIMDSFSLWIRRESEAAHKRLTSLVSTLAEPKLTGLFVQKKEAKQMAGEQDSVKKQLTKIVKKLTGSDGIEIPKELAAKLQDNPLYKEYLKLRRGVTAVYKDRVFQLVRSSGKHYLPYDEIINILNREKIAHKLPQGFVGNIGEKCELYTSTGKKLKGYPGSATEVVMNPNYDPVADNAYVFKAKPLPTSKLQRYYTVDYDKGSSAAKFEVVDQLADNIVKVRTAWRQDLNTTGRKQLCALLCELAYLTSARIGNVNAKSEGVQTFGLSTIQVKHVKISASAIDIKFIPKSGVKKGEARVVHFKIPIAGTTTKKVARILTDLMEGKKPSEYLITYNDKFLTSNTMTKYLQSIGAPDGATLHKFRHLRGTVLAQKIISESPFKGKGNYSDKEVNNWFMKAMEEVGKELGHVNGDKVTPNTAITNYINPSLMGNFYNKLGIRPPSIVQRAIDRAKTDKS